MAAVTPTPVYFELSWSILSTIGITNFFLGLLVASITSFSPIAFVPIVVSAAAAIANGLSYYAFYAHHSVKQTIAVAAVADILWMVQEAGLSFYSYQILVRVLHARVRLTFMITFWSLMFSILAIRMTILINRSCLIHSDPSYNAVSKTYNDPPASSLSETIYLQRRIDRLHIGYFTAIALVEILSSTFLLRVFMSAQKTSQITNQYNIKYNGNAYSEGLFKLLIRSTEIRLATLCVLGLTRSVTYNLQQAAQIATGIAGQIDRFAYTLECMFPLIMMLVLIFTYLQLCSSDCMALFLGEADDNATGSIYSHLNFIPVPTATYKLDIGTIVEGTITLPPWIKGQVRYKIIGQARQWDSASRERLEECT